MDGRVWYYVRQNQQQGPMPEPELRVLFAAGQLDPVTLVWTEGMAQWTTAMAAGLAAQQSPGQSDWPAAADGPGSAAGVGLAPSEIILLCGDQITTRAMLRNVDLPHTESVVAGPPLAEAMLAAAVLGNEQQGAVRLVTEQKKALFGLKSITTLRVEPGATQPAWPAYSLESQILPLVQQGLRDVNHLVHALLQEDTYDGAAQTVLLVKKGLAARQLLTVEQIKKALVLTTDRYRATPAAAALLAAHPLAPNRQLLADTQRTRPDVWKALTAQIGLGIRRRTESGSDNDWGSALDND